MLLVYRATHQETLNMTFEVWGSHRGVTEDSSLLGCDPVVLGEWFQTIQGSTVPSKCQEPFRTTHPLTWYHIPLDSKPRSSKLSNEVTKSIKNCVRAWCVYRTVSCWAFLAQGQQIQY